MLQRPLKWDHNIHSPPKLKALKRVFSLPPPQFTVLTNHSQFPPSFFLLLPARHLNSSNHSATSLHHQRYPPPVLGHSHGRNLPPVPQTPSWAAALHTEQIIIFTKQNKNKIRTTAGIILGRDPCEAFHQNPFYSSNGSLVQWRK